MGVLVDTSVWSLALRKAEKTKKEEEITQILAKVIRDMNLVLIGPIRQEILSGIHDKKKYLELKSKIGVFKDSVLETSDYELAAEYFNICRGKGIQGSHIDYLICAFSVNKHHSIFTLDNDFLNYKMHLPIKLEGIA